MEKENNNHSTTTPTIKEEQVMDKKKKTTLLLEEQVMDKKKKKKKKFALQKDQEEEEREQEQQDSSACSFALPLKENETSTRSHSSNNDSNHYHYHKHSPKIPLENQLFSRVLSILCEPFFFVTPTFKNREYRHLVVSTKDHKKGEEAACSFIKKKKQWLIELIKFPPFENNEKTIDSINYSVVLLVTRMYQSEQEAMHCMFTQDDDEEKQFIHQQLEESTEEDNDDDSTPFYLRELEQRDYDILPSKASQCWRLSWNIEYLLSFDDKPNIEITRIKEENQLEMDQYQWEYQADHLVLQRVLKKLFGGKCRNSEIIKVMKNH